jgi:predicted nucleic acid-binding protein
VAIGTHKQVSVFLDASVLLDYLRGSAAGAHLFDPEIIARARYSIDPTVLREILLLADASERSKLLELIKERISLLSIKPDKISQTLRRIKDLRNRIAHSDDVMILASASDCDYLVTADLELLQLQQGSRPEVVTVDQFLERLSRKS